MRQLTRPPPLDTPPTPRTVEVDERSCQHEADEDADRREQLDEEAVQLRRAAGRLLLRRD